MSVLSKLILVCGIALGGCVAEASDPSEENDFVSSDDKLTAGSSETGATRAGGAIRAPEANVSSTTRSQTPSVGGEGTPGRQGEDEGGPPPVPWLVK